MEKILNNGDILLTILEWLNIDDQLSMLEVHDNFAEVYLQYICKYDTFMLGKNSRVEGILKKFRDSVDTVNVIGGPFIFDWRTLKQFMHVTRIHLTNIKVYIEDVCHIATTLPNVLELIINNVKYLEIGELTDVHTKIPSIKYLNVQYSRYIKNLIYNCVNAERITLHNVEYCDAVIATSNQYHHYLLPHTSICQQINELLQEIREIPTDDLKFKISANIKISTPSVHIQFIRIASDKFEEYRLLSAISNIESIEYIQTMHSATPVLHFPNLRHFSGKSITHFPKILGKADGSIDLDYGYIFMHELYQNLRATHIRKLTLSNLFFHQFNVQEPRRVLEHYATSVKYLELRTSEDDPTIATFLMLLSKYPNGFENVESLVLDNLKLSDSKLIMSRLCVIFPKVKYITLNFGKFSPDSIYGLLAIKSLKCLRLLNCYGFWIREYCILRKYIAKVDVVHFAPDEYEQLNVRKFF